MKTEEFKEILLQVLELQLEYQLRAIRQLRGKPEAEPATVHRRGRRRQSLVDLSVQILTENGRALHVNELSFTPEALRPTHRQGRPVQCAGEKGPPRHLLSQSAPATFALFGSGGIAMANLSCKCLQNGWTPSLWRSLKKGGI